MFDWIAHLVLKCFKTNRTASIHTVTSFAGVGVKNFNYNYKNHPVYEFGGVKLVPIEALQSGEENFKAVGHYHRQARELHRAAQLRK